MSNDEASPPHVAVIAFPYGSHAATIIAIIRHLAHISPSTHFSFLNTPATNANLFSVKNPKNLTRHDVPEPPQNGRHYSVVVEEFMSTAEDMFRKEVAEVEVEVGRRVTCLVTEAFFGFAAEMAAEMGVGWLAIWVCGPASLSAHLHTDLIREKIGTQGVSGLESVVLDFIPGMTKFRVQDIPPEVFGDINSGFPRALHQMARALPKATSVFINSFEALDPTITADLSSKLHRFLNIAPFNLILNQPASLDLHECLPWLDTQKANSVTYIGFGRVTVPPPPELVAIAEALEESQTPFLWSLKDDMRTHLPEGFLERMSELGKIVAWAPQVDILDHSSVGVFITHCGWNSVLEGLISGVPMIGRPIFGDHKINARLISDVLEIGGVVEGGTFTKDGLTDILKVIMIGETGVKMREKGEELKKAAREAVKEDGGSVRGLKVLLELVNEVIN